MTLNEFLYEDEDLFHAYQKAYLNRTSFNSWVQGMYNHNAQSVVMHNSFSKKEKAISYIEKPINFVPEETNKNESKEIGNSAKSAKELDQEYRDFMIKHTY